MWRPILLLLFFVLTILPTTMAQMGQRSNLSTRLLETRDLRPPTEAADERVAKLYLAHGLADKILTLQAVRARSMGLARMADALWTEEESYARTLFEKALNTTSAVASDDKEAKLLASLHNRVIVMIARRDPDWAKRLIDLATQTGEAERDSKGRSAMNLAAANSLLTSDPALAIGFAERSLRGYITPAFLEFLTGLRKTDQAAANSLFLQVLAQLNQESISDIKGFHTLGLYLFTAPGLLDSDEFAITRVGDILVPNIAAQRPGIPLPLIREYLRTAGAELWRSASDPAQKQYSYALAYLLLPKARGIAPDLAPPIEAAMATMSSSVPQNITQESAYDYIKALPPSAEDRLASAEKKPDQDSREAAYLDLVRWAWRKGDFETARLANSRIARPELSQKVTTLIDFGEAVHVLNDNPNEAWTTAKRLANGIEKSVLLLAVAGAKAKQGATAEAEEALDSAIKTSRSVEDARRPFILLTAAGALADLHSANTPAQLSQSIKDLNSFAEASFTSVDWAENVQAGHLQARFSLVVNDLDLSFNRAFRHAIASDPGGGIARAEEIRSESLRAQAFVEVATELMKQIAETSQDQRLVQVGEDGMRKTATKTIMPEYPKEDLKKRQQGIAVAELQYDGKGDVTKASILESPTNSIGDAVVQAIRQWKFVPSKTMDGKPVSVRGKLTFYFVIDKGKGRVENPKQFR